MGADSGRVLVRRFTQNVLYLKVSSGGSTRFAQQFRVSRRMKYITRSLRHIYGHDKLPECISSSQGLAVYAWASSDDVFGAASCRAEWYTQWTYLLRGPVYLGRGRGTASYQSDKQIDGAADIPQATDA